MIPVINEPVSISIREQGIESIIDWFDQHKQSFYTIGWSYLKNQQQIEEVVYRSIIKVHKELPRFKRDVSFETWVTSIFIQTCREHSNNRSLLALEESEPRQAIFKALDQLKEDEKEAIVLTYIKGNSHDEAVHILQVSVEKVKELLFSGIQSLRSEMGYGLSFNGCKEYHNNYIDYLERTLERSKKLDLEIHIFHCQDCQADLATFQEVMLVLTNLTERMENLTIPSNFMANVKSRIAEKEKHKQQKDKKRKRIVLVFTSIFVLLMGIEFFTGAFNNLYYTWTEEDPQLRAFLKQDLGERLNLETESDGVKIKINGAIADDVQTLVFYEIEDMDGDDQYAMNVDDGVMVENQNEILSGSTDQRYYPPDLKSDVNNKEKNVYHGKISLRPLYKKKGTVELKITKLQKLIRDSSDSDSVRIYEDMTYKTGKWNFKVPVTKQPSVKYAVDEEIKIEGIPVRFDKLTVAPTATILQYRIDNKKPEKRIEELNLDNIKVNNQKLKADLYNSSYFGSQQFQAYFDPLYGEKLKEVKVQLESVYLTINDPKTIDLNAAQAFPKTFEYAGSTISIDKFEVGQCANIVISNREIKDRVFESLHFNLSGDGESESTSIDESSKGVFVDKYGKEYDPEETPFSYEDIKQPRFFVTFQSMNVLSNNPGENVIPNRLEIYGYNTTKYLDDVVKISLKEPSF